MHMTPKQYANALRQLKAAANRASCIAAKLRHDAELRQDREAMTHYAAASSNATWCIIEATRADCPADTI